MNGHTIFFASALSPARAKSLNQTPHLTLVPHFIYRCFADKFFKTKKKKEAKKCVSVCPCPIINLYSRGDATIACTARKRFLSSLHLKEAKKSKRDTISHIIWIHFSILLHIFRRHLSQFSCPYCLSFCMNRFASHKKSKCDMPCRAVAAAT